MTVRKGWPERYHPLMTLTSQWCKSSRSAAGGQCVEVAWRKSSYSTGNGQCVEMAPAAGRILVRDSKVQDGPVLAFTPGAWAAFTGWLRREA